MPDLVNKVKVRNIITCNEVLGGRAFEVPARPGLAGHGGGRRVRIKTNNATRANKLDLFVLTLDSCLLILDSMQKVIIGIRQPRQSLGEFY